ncbi:SapC family protein [uncultured Campylobacter sp.]|uniref:SapC family protein n=1 Tax=uncultured Campylobacter sp. TaxID=218934 RepID=UPI0026017E01|nr:SapC family protein [uncultured Campylobacter sp.]
MGRAIREIKSEMVLIKQKGSFFSDESEKELYIEILNSLAQKHDMEILGYVLESGSVSLFLKSLNIPKIMQELNSAFIRNRNKKRGFVQESDIKRYEIRDVFINEFEDVLAFLQKSGGYTFKNIDKNLSLAKRIEIQNFKKRTEMKVVALNSEVHKGLSYHQDELPNFPFAEIVASEAFFCDRDLAIVFTNDVVPKLLVLLGRNENLIIDKDYKGYVPAIMQNYPFTVAKVEDQTILCVDEDAPQLKGKGEKLFKKNEEPSDFLKNTITAIQNYNAELAATQKALEEIKKAGILINKELTVSDNDKKITLIKGFSVVSRKKLNELDDATLADFARKGYISLIDAHIRSLSNLQNLAAKILENESKTANENK